MQANRRANTKPEVALRSALHRLGYRYRKDLLLRLDGGVRARPDIVFTARKVAVFVDGCFWHACPDHGRQPTVNEWYWTPKLARNVERDRKVTRALMAAGWDVVRIWEHETMTAALHAVTAAINRSSNTRAKLPAGPDNPAPARAADGGEPAKRSSASSA